MDSKAETTKRIQTTNVGALELTLSLDASGTNHRTLTQVRSSSGKLAQEVPIVLASLLFMERQMRMINDPSRLSAVGEMDEAYRAAREGRLIAPSAPSNGRTVATYRIELLANGGFQVNVEEKLAGVLSDAAGGMAAGVLPTELLTTLREPYRAFYLEMLGAAVGFWRERRPSPIESTWVWKVALRRLDQLMRGGVEGLGEPLVCPSCQALRPAGFPCLHCESAPGEGPVGEAAISSTTSSPSSVGSSPESRPSEPVVEAPAETVPSMTLSAPPPAAQSAHEPAVTSTAPDRTDSSDRPSGERSAEPAILPARELPTSVVVEAEEPPRRPLAGLLPRGLSLVVDAAIGFVLASLGSLGLTTILMVSGALGGADDPRTVFSALWLIFFALYFVFGWTGGQTYGMMICRIQVVQEAGQKRCGFFHAVGRAIGYVLVVALGLIVFVIGIWIDDNILTFIPGGTPADEAIRVIVGLCALYVMWLGSGQRILGEVARQTWGDKVGKTLVVARQKAS